MVVYKNKHKKYTTFQTKQMNYHYPPNLKRERVPPEVFEFFDRMHNPEISDGELFKSKLNFEIGGCPCVIGFGGIHGALNNYMEESQEVDDC